MQRNFATNNLILTDAFSSSLECKLAIFFFLTLASVVTGGVTQKLQKKPGTLVWILLWLVWFNKQIIF
jgi:hypothetical protein